MSKLAKTAFPNWQNCRRWILAAVVLVALGSVFFFDRRIRARHRLEAAQLRLLRKQKKAAQAALPEKTARPATSVIARLGLANLRAKMLTQKSATVAFLGGSITQNASQDGFVSAACKWLKHRVPGAAIRVINGGVAATGSDFGAQRVNRDILVENPDLIFVEFAVNDSDRDCVADIERIVRKIRSAQNRAEIILLYTVTRESIQGLREGKFPVSVRRHEAVAAHYGLPTIALGWTAAEKLSRGEMTWADFSADECHPTSAGYLTYNCDLERALDELWAKGETGARSLPPSLVPDLVLSPPPLEAAPFPDQIRHSSNGPTAVSSLEYLPDPGRQWIADPEFSLPSGAGCLLAYRSLETPLASLESAPDFHRHACFPERWFPEARTFTGSDSLPLVKWESGFGVRFGASPHEAPVLLWRAPRAEQVEMQISVQDLVSQKASEQARAALSVVHFFVGRDQGESLARHEISAAEAAQPWRLTATCEVEAGDELACFFEAHQFKLAAFRGLKIAIGEHEISSPKKKNP